MSCSPFDLRDYFLHELADPQQRQVEAHVETCPACREELDRLRLTEAALFSLRDEEIPQRIAFVSDAVFEPSRWHRWWAAFWGSSARLGFAGAALIAVALLVNAGWSAAVPLTSADVDRRIHAAVAASEARLTQKTTQLVHQLVEQRDNEHNLRVIAQSDAEYQRKLNYTLQVDSGSYVHEASIQGGLR